LNEAIIAGMVLAGIALAFGVTGSFAHGRDREQIRNYFIAKGERLLETQWDPWQWGGMGGWRAGDWGGWGNDRNTWYRVRYIDREGNEHTARCRSSGALGIDFYDDSVVRHVDDPNQPSRAQEAENRLLREEESKLARKPKPEDDGR
jgi:hypothetical protein